MSNAQLVEDDRVSHALKRLSPQELEQVIAEGINAALSSNYECSVQSINYDSKTMDKTIELKVTLLEPFVFGSGLDSE